MNSLRCIFMVVLGMFLVSLCSQIGCQPQQPLYLTEKGNYKKHLTTKATRIDYPDTNVPSTLEVCQTLEPLTLDNPNPTDYWDLTLEEAIQMALKNSKVVRTLNGVGFSQAGVSGTPGTLLASPAAVGTVYDPALTESDPRYGIEAALSAFDGQLTATANWSKTDVPQRTFGTPNPYISNYQDDAGTFSVGINKYAATGGQFYANHVNQYRMGDTTPVSWTSYLEGGFRQPLLQGMGIQFNRIAGPGATPGFYNGVTIARISTDMALNDFEMAARNLVADVEKAYWNLYYAYHRLESVKSGRDAAHQTWAQTYAMYKVSVIGGRAQYEAQARNNYFTFRAQSEVAQSNLFKTENTLRYIIGLTSTDGRLIRPVDDPIIAPLKLDWQNVVCESLLRSPELRKQKWDVKRRELELIASKNFLLPRLDFNANYRWTGAGKDLLNPDNSRSNAYGSLTSGNYASWVMGFEASMPFGWRKELAGVRNAQLQLARSRAVLQEQELELTHQLADSFREISQAYQQSRTVLQRRIAADDEVSSVNAAYKAGTTTLDQLLDAQRRQAEAETEYYRSIVDYNLAIMMLHYRKGSLLEYNNVALSEGAWPAKAYFDAKRRARERDAGHYLNYGFTRPRVVSRGIYQQHQNKENTIFDGQMFPESVPSGSPLMAPPPPQVIETQSNIPLLPSKSAVVPATNSVPLTNNETSGSSLTNSQVSFTTPSVVKPVPTRNNRYVDAENSPSLPPL
ncbi:MAG: TolC family protein [Planctomycetaceae bacterium]|nr:TolC family protein [Planctomycetaceae bacterium]